MPSPMDAVLPLVKQFRADMHAVGRSELDYTDLEGYVDAMVFCEVLKKAGPNLSRESFLSAAEGLQKHEGGLSFSYSKTNHQAMSKIYLTKISGNKIVVLQ